MRSRRNTAKGPAKKPGPGQGVGGGRPSKLPGLDLAQVEVLGSLGLTEEKIARALDVTGQTIRNWKHKSPKFFEAIKRGQAKSEARVAKSLYEMAIGEPAKRIQPNVTAAIFFLKNRAPESWRDRHDVDHGGSVRMDGKLVIEVVETRG